MKEFAGTASNYFLAEQDDKLVGFAEMVLLLSEPSHRLAAGSNSIYVERSKLHEVRFGATADALTGLIKHLIKTRDDLLELEATHAK